MSARCLYCYEALPDAESDYHSACIKQFFGTSEPPTLEYSLDQMANLAADTVLRSVVVTGVQPKLSLTLVKDVLNKNSAGRLTVVGALGGHYILKPPYSAYPEMPQNEHLTMLIARTLNIPVVPSILMRLSSGELSYVTKRIDRTDLGDKIHMLDMFQVLEAFDKYRGSMERVGKGVKLYSDAPLTDLFELFQLTVFCFLTGNNDMHLKNFSMIARGENQWRLAPAYDLLNVAIANPDDTEELALTIDARKSKFNRKRLLAFGSGLGLNARQMDVVFNNYFDNENKMTDLVAQSFLSEEFKEKYLNVLRERYDRLKI